MEKRNVIVISFDAVSSQDLEKLSKMKNFSKLIENGALIKNVESVSPSLTYPAHVTIMTGKYPSEHGVINNTFLEINNNSPNWYWYNKYIKSNTVFDLALKNNLTVASILWPVTGRSKITYNMPEIHCNRFYDNQIIKSILAGSLFYQYKMNKKFGHIRQGIEEPMLDDFSMEVAKATIKEKNPNLLLLHLIDTDFQKHLYGTTSKEVEDSLIRHDRRMGEIIQTLKDCNMYENTTIVALGDHSQCDVNFAIRLNSLFKKENLIKVKNKKIKDYKAIANSCDGSTYIYCKDENSKGKVDNLLRKLQNEENSPIKRIYKDEEIVNLGADTKASFLVEAKDGYYFVNGHEGDLVCPLSSLNKDEHKEKACHGYVSSKDNYSTFFIASGPDIKKGIVLEEGKLINHGPTIAKTLGLKLENATGKVVDEIFK